MTSELAYRCHYECDDKFHVEAPAQFEAYLIHGPHGLEEALAEYSDEDGEWALVPVADGVVKKVTAYRTVCGARFSAIPERLTVWRCRFCNLMHEDEQDADACCDGGDEA